MRAYDIAKLIETHGDMMLSDLKLKLMGDRKFLCPECRGKGVKQKTYDAYPKGLPDSGWVNDLYYQNESCKLCEGHAYTVKEYVPKMIQQGWMVR